MEGETGAPVLSQAVINGISKAPCPCVCVCVCVGVCESFVCVCVCAWTKSVTNASFRVRER